MRGGRRTIKGCFVEKSKKFHPLLPLPNEFMDWFVEEYNVVLSKLYYPPFNFKRTGCVGCPFNIKLQDELDILKQLLPNEYKKANLIWKKVYDEYKRIGFRLKPDSKQLTIFDL